MKRPSSRVVAFVVGLLAAVIPAWAYFGFTIDDALIPARYAHHVATGHGYRFNVDGPITDGVTPLGFVYLLVPFAKAGPLAALAAARWGGLVTWLVAAGCLGVEVDRVGSSRWRFAGLALVLASAPLGAWASAGLETPVATSLVTLGLVLRSRERHYLGAVALGLAALMRPEALPLALCLAFPAGPRVAPDEAAGSPTRKLGGAHFGRVALAAAPFALAAVTRTWVFGRAAPLSVLAKPPHLAEGAVYALACFLLTGPLSIAAPLAWRRLEAWPRWLVGAVLVHFAAIAGAGGDWMPLSRLVVPVLPVVVLACAHVASVSGVPFTIGRLVLALGGEVFAFSKKSVSGPRVMEDRLALIAEARPVLARAKVVATEDAGWVGAATEATVVDLAGVTDPFVAALPGSHTDKRIPDTFLDAHRVDVLVLQLKDDADLATPWWTSKFARGVERYVALGPGVGDSFEPVLVTTGRLKYVLCERVRAEVAAVPPHGD
jgi:hypothetical protein